MSSVLAVVAKAVYEKQAKALELGDVWKIERYASNHPNLAVLEQGGSLYLVTVRPGDELWLVGVLTSPTLGAEGWKGNVNTTPIRDITALRPKFKSSLRTPRELTADDVALFADASAFTTTLASAKAPAAVPKSKGATRVVLSAKIKKAIDTQLVRKPSLPGILSNPHTRAAIEKMIANGGDLHALGKRVLAWVDDEERFTTKYDDEVQLAAHAIYGRYGTSRDYAVGWLQASNLQRAVSLAIQPSPLHVGVGESLCSGPPKDGSPIYILSELFSLALERPDAERRAIRLDPKITPTLDTSSQVSLAMIRGDGEAIDAFARRAATDGAFAADIEARGLWTMRTFLSEVRDPDTWEALAKASPRQLLYGGAPTFARAMARMPAEHVARALAAILVSLGDKKWRTSAGDYKHVVSLAACVDNEAIADLLARKGQVKNLAVIVVAYFEGFPHRIASLEAAANERGKVGEVAKTILEAVRRKTAGAKQSANESNTDVPSYLLTPPWETATRKTEPYVFEAPIPDRPATHLTPGEHLRWIDSGADHHRIVDEFREKGTLGTWGYQYLEGLISLLGDEAIAAATLAAARKPADCIELLLHVASPRSAVALSTLLGKSIEAPRIRAWLARHADVAVLGLVPAAIGADPKQRAGARDALAWLVACGKKDLVTIVAKTIDRDAGPAIFAQLASDELPTPGKLPDFATPSALPAPVLAKTNSPLGPSAVTTLLGLLSVLPKHASHPLAQQLKKDFTTESLDTFVWTLVTDYVMAGAHGRHDWVVYAAGQIGSDAIARKIAAAIPQWVGKSVELMQRGLDALALIGTDVALSLLYERGLAAKFEDTQTRVHQLLEQVAARAGISYDELEDRLVPELGLDRGPVVLDYGAHSYQVKLDEQLMPFIVADGQRLAKIPKAVAGDDPAKAKAALERFATLSDDLEHVARSQVLRFERAMREARSWPESRWEDQVLGHPLLRYLASRLVWDVDGALLRVAEDGTLTDDRDKPFAPKPTARVRVAHPLDVDTQAWARMARIFSDYEVLQPFAQIARETFNLSHIDKDVECDDWVGRKASWSSVMELLTGRGWQRTAPVDGTVQTLVLPLDRLGAPGVRAELVISPGLTIGTVKARPTQTLGNLSLHGARASFAALTARASSEILRDVATLGV